MANKAWLIGLAVLSGVLAILCVALAVSLYNRSRFVQLKGQNPYVMFDTKTAQACWSGPVKPLPDDFFSNPSSRDPNPMPACKDLR
jgi:hypothetical protein